MSFLAPLFFLGALGVAAPILFHLIRQTPKNSIPFSSVMFLREVPPRLTRRSRLDQWPLLLIRSLALLLLAFAFARPFLRDPESKLAGEPVRRVAILIDRSASMQREDLWRQATAQAESVLDDLSAQDQFAVFSFDNQVTRHCDTDSQTDASNQSTMAAARQAIAGMKPTWHATDLGAALREAADWVQWSSKDSTPTDGDSTAATGPTSVVLISDLQRGASLDALQQNTWPEQVFVDLRRIQPKQSGNAVAVVMTDQQAATLRDSTAESDGAGEVRLPVRIINSEDADEVDFSLAWNDQPEQQTIQVDAGSTQTVRVKVPRPKTDASSKATQLTLSGDAHAFDNVVHWIQPEKRSFELLYVGSKVDDPRDSLLYYLQRIPLNDANRNVVVQSVLPTELPDSIDPDECPLVVIGGVQEDDSFDQSIADYLRGGGRVLFVLGDPNSTPTMLPCIKSVTGDSGLSATEADVNDYAMLSRIDFSDPLFAAMSDPQFNDFSKIQFWNHRDIAGMNEEWNVIARFDSGSPAIARSGNVWLMAAGWQPAASQLALSTKFIPLIAQLFAGNQPASSSGIGHIVGEPLPWPPSQDAKLVRSDGESSSYETSDDAAFIDRPGVYQWVVGDESPIQFASNLDGNESQTEPIDDDTLERLGVGLGQAPTAQELTRSTQQLRDRELEQNQNWWQWLLLGAIALLAIETLWGGRHAQRIA